MGAIRGAVGWCNCVGAAEAALLHGKKKECQGLNEIITLKHDFKSSISQRFQRKLTWTSQGAEEGSTFHPGQPQGRGASSSVVLTAGIFEAAIIILMCHRIQEEDHKRTHTKKDWWWYVLCTTTTTNALFCAILASQ